MHQKTLLLSQWVAWCKNQAQNALMIGYARVSTKGQTLVAQIEQLKAAGCTTIFQETESGARTDRPKLKKAIAALEHGDVLMVTRLDRLARSSRDLLNIVEEAGQRGAAFKSLAEAWADTTTPHGKLMLTVLAGLAEFERSLIAARTSEGRARAVKAGKRLGRPPLLTPAQQAEAARLVAKGKSQAEIGQLLRVSRSTVTRFVAKVQAA
jgi:DNA invertase Pin-like site-specific DNA recombinase